MSFSSARGNTSLESAVTLTKQLRWGIQTLGQRLQVAANAEEIFQGRSARAQEKAEHALELKAIAQSIRNLLTRIEDAVPLLNLAITASGANLSSSLPTTVSPSRLLQASTFVTAGDSQYATSQNSYMQIGPTFLLSLYMLFAGHIRPQNDNGNRESTWKEVIHKAVVRLMRCSIDSLHTLPRSDQSSLEGQTPNTPNATDARISGQLTASTKVDEFAYQLVIVEDLHDDRVHVVEDGKPQPGAFQDIELAGVRKVVPIHELSKIFYADTGKILNIGSEGEANNPVLLLRRDLDAVPPRRMAQRGGEADYDDDSCNDKSVALDSLAAHGRQDTEKVSVLNQQPSHASTTRVAHLQPDTVTNADPWQLPLDLDPEWMAFEVYTENDDSDEETDDESAPSVRNSRPSRTPSVPNITTGLSQLNVSTPAASPSPLEDQSWQPQKQNLSLSALPPIRTSLSLLETLLRLLSLQQFQQTPHLSIPDELLTFFLSESASTGAATNDVQERKRVREEARRRVGFDPYDESPVKRRGEDYQYRGNENDNAWDVDRAQDSFTDERYGSPIRSDRYDDEGYDTHNSTFPTPSVPAPSTPSRASSGTPDSRNIRKPMSGGSAKSMSMSSGPSPDPNRRPTPLMTRRSDGGRYRLRDSPSVAGVAVGAKKGSPLAGPGTGLKDEGLGTSPSTANVQKG